MTSWAVSLLPQMGSVARGWSLASPNRSSCGYQENPSPEEEGARCGGVGCPYRQVPP